MSDAPHAITSLTLENFRNYRRLALTLPPRPVVLRGHNGAGKTNILEALSLLAPGRGFRHAKLSEMDAMGAGGMPWVVAAQVTTRGEVIQMGTGRDGGHSSPIRAEDEKGAAGNTALGNAPLLTSSTVTEATPGRARETRIVKINGEKIRGHAALAQHVCIQWLTPAMDQVFVEGGTARRKLLDRIVYGFESEHATRVNAYELAMRERNRLLADRAMADPYWLSVLEQQMAEHAVAMTLARQEVIARLQNQLAEPLSHFPRAEIGLEGMLETWLESGDSALDAEAKFAARLMEVRGPDSARGRATVGPHRSHFAVTHRSKSMPAERCSTGEQKALLLSIILASARARAAWCGLPPILLLDEVIAHLDVDKRSSLFDLIRQTAIQAWMTGTDAADFKGLEGFATPLEIDGGTVKIC